MTTANPGPTCPVCGHDTTDSDHETSHMQYVRGREQIEAIGGPRNQTVELKPVVHAPGVMRLGGAGDPPVYWDPSEVLDINDMSEQLIAAGLSDQQQQDALEKVIEAQLQFLAHQLSGIRFFLQHSPYDGLTGEDPTPLRLKTVAYQGRMEVTLLMGAPDEPPKEPATQSEALGAEAPQPAEDEDGSSLEQPRDDAPGA